MKTQDIIKTIKRLHEDDFGLSQHQIAKQLKISRNTVAKYIKLSSNEIENLFQDRTRTKKLDLYRPYLYQQIKFNPNISSIRLKLKLESQFEIGEINDRTFRRYVQALKQTYQQDCHFLP